MDHSIHDCSNCLYVADPDQNWPATAQICEAVFPMKQFLQLLEDVQQKPVQRMKPSALTLTLVCRCDSIAQRITMSRP